jgi:hypothetical protein
MHTAFEGGRNNKKVTSGHKHGNAWQIRHSRLRKRAAKNAF